MATYYWVGGNGTWDTTTKTNWATVSGGAGGNGPPIISDNVNFDSASGTGTCTTAAGATCGSVTLNSSTLALTLGANLTLTSAGSTTFTLTLGALNLSLYSLTTATFLSNNSNTRSIAFGTGNITLTGNATTIWNTGTATGFSITGTSNVICTYSGATGTRSISCHQTAGGSAANAISFSVTAGTDIFNISSGSYVNNVTFTGFSGSAATGSATKFIYGNLVYASTMTITAGTGGWTFSATSGTQKITSAALNLDFNIIQNGVGGTVQFQDALTQGATRTFTITNGTLQFSAGTTNTIGTFVTSGTTRKYLQSSVSGTQATLTKASGTTSVSYLTIQDSVVNTSTTWNAYTNSGISSTLQNINNGNNIGWKFIPSGMTFAGF